MKVSQIKRAAALIALLAPTAGMTVGCSSKSSTPAPTPGSDAGATDAATDSSTSDAAADAGSGFSLKIPCTDTIASIYADPGTLSGTPGKIIRCAPDSVMSAADLYAAATAVDPGGTPPYSGPEFASGAKVYRILYETKRGDAAGSKGYSSGLMFLPDTPRAAQSPIVVASHGSRGQAPICTPSKNEDAGASVEPDFIHQVYPLAGYGYAVVASDLAGYANFGAAGNSMSAYGNAKDVGQSSLDGARALANALKGQVSSKLVITGHSQGGGTAFSTLALAPTYAPEFTIAATAVYAPLWFSLRSFSEILYLPSMYPLPGQPGGSSAGPVSIWYHYTSAELFDGPGAGLALFTDAGAAAVKSFVENDCWSGDYAQLDTLGKTPADIFDPAFAQSLGQVSLPWNFSFNAITPPQTPISCHNDAGGPMADSDYPACACALSNNIPLCTKWMARYMADRPHLTGAAASAPLLIVQGGQDNTVQPNLAACVLDRMKEDKANYSFCFNPDQSHSGVVAATADYVNQWIAQQALGASAPSKACPGNEANLVDDAGTPIQCFSLLGPQ